MIGGLSEVEVIGALDRGAHSHVFRAKQRRTDRQLVWMTSNIGNEGGEV
jgi:hypothetical protein